MSTLHLDDVFNETDDDCDQRVVKINYNRSTAICCSIKKEDESEETEQEYDLDYVQGCVQKRNIFRRAGYHECNVKDIYKMSKTDLQTGETEHQRD